jgi:Helix-turn-helix domain
MSRRLPNPRLVKIHRNYTVEEIAGRFSVHKNTVRNWIRAGLPTSDKKRPTLILGRDLQAFFARRRTANKRPCRVGEMYCLKCRAPRVPAGGMVEVATGSATTANLVAICERCETLMYRRVNFAKADAICDEMRRVIRHPERHIAEIN